MPTSASFCEKLSLIEAPAASGPMGRTVSNVSDASKVASMDLKIPTEKALAATLPRLLTL